MEKAQQQAAGTMHQALPSSLELLISHVTVFFSHNKTASIGLSAVEIISIINSSREHGSVC
jgi:hypothetical protein